MVEGEKEKMSKVAAELRFMPFFEVVIGFAFWTWILIKISLDVYTLYMLESWPFREAGGTLPISDY